MCAASSWVNCSLPSATGFDLRAATIRRNAALASLAAAATIPSFIAHHLLRRAFAQRHRQFLLRRATLHTDLHPRARREREQDASQVGIAGDLGAVQCNNDVALLHTRALRGALPGGIRNKTRDQHAVVVR